jgi:FK506-binding protein 2
MVFRLLRMLTVGPLRTLTIPPELGYGNRGMGPIPAGSTLIFETEIVGIDGVPKPETIVTKPLSSTSSSASSEATEDASRIVDKATSVVAEAAKVAATIIADSDDGQEHNEL